MIAGGAMCAGGSGAAGARWMAAWDVAVYVSQPRTAGAERFVASLVNLPTDLVD